MEDKQFSITNWYNNYGYVIFDNNENENAASFAKSLTTTNTKSNLDISLEQLRAVLSSLISQETQKEQAFFNEKIPPGSDLRKTKIWNAIQSGNISAAFNLIIQTERALQLAYQHEKNNKLKMQNYLFLNRNLGTFIKQKFSDMLKRSGNRITSELKEGTSSFTIKSLVKEFLAEVNIDKNLKEYQQAEKLVMQALKNGGFMDLSFIENGWIKKDLLEKYFNNSIKIKEKGKSGSAVLENIRKKVSPTIQGLIVEQIESGVINMNKENGFSAYVTGGMRAKGNLIKNVVEDLAIFDINTDQFETAVKYADKSSEERKTVFKNFLGRLEELNKGIKIYGMTVNMKAYFSGKAFSMQKVTPPRVVDEIPNINQNFILALKNIVDGAFLQNQRDAVLEGLMARSAAFMFSDIDEYFVGHIQDDLSTSNIVHLVNFNGMYYTLSDILKKIQLQLNTSIQSNEIMKINYDFGEAQSEIERVKNIIKNGINGGGKYHGYRPEKEWENVSKAANKNSFEIVILQSAINEIFKNMASLLV